ncbi:hypothetical protein HDK90DRAFT_204220 [Phyllosticta capitalensis]|uniref:DUF6604 domain-containing protein n=1 Tax=Phyllosticta capitalensis TaxID=121624 RepID=A0ABR1YS15_9PEZI
MPASDLLSKFLTSSYQQYKEDTNTVASWLTSTARRCGYPEDLLAKEAVKAAKKRKPKKKKKRKNTSAGVSDAPQSTPGDPGAGSPGAGSSGAGSSGAGSSGAGSSSAGNSKTDASSAPKPDVPGPTKDVPPTSNASNAPAPSSYTYLISINDFLTLAEFIAAKKPAEKVPHYFVQSLNRAISVRKKHGATVAARQPEDTDSNERHSYFIGVLEGIKELLRPSFATSTSTSEIMPEISVSVDFTNSFAGLNIEEPSQKFQDAPDIVIPERPQPDTTALQRQEEAEAYTAFSLLLDDLHNIRCAIRDIWEHLTIRYRRVAAVLATNTAIDFARELEQDLLEVMEKFGGVGKMLEKVWGDKCRSKGEDPDYRDLPEDRLNIKLYEDAEKLMIPAYHCLDSFVTELRTGNGIPGYTPLDLKSRGNQQSAFKQQRKKYQTARTEMARFLSILGVFCTEAYPDGAFVEDELTRGLRIVCTTHKISLWNIFSVQILLEIHRILGDECSIGFKTFTHVKGWIAESIDSYFDLQDGDPDLRTEHDQTLKDLDKRLKNNFSRGDRVRDACTRLGRPLPQTHWLFQSNPILSGLWQYSAQYIFSETGIKIASDMGAILSAKHLYRAFSKERFFWGSWKDMDAVLICQRDINFMRIAESASPDVYVRRYLLDMGASASDFARDNNRRIPLTTARPKPLRSHVDLMRIFKHRFCMESRRVSFSPEDLKKIMEKTSFWEESDDEDPFKIRDFDGGIRIDRGMVLNDRPDSSRSRNLQRQPIPKLLKKLAVALHGELLVLVYDYLYMHTFCWKLLQSEKDTQDDEFKQMYGYDYLASSRQLPKVAGYILMAAVDDTKFPNGLLNPKRQRRVTKDFMEDAALRLDVMALSGESDVVCLVAEALHSVYHGPDPMTPGTEVDNAVDAANQRDPHQSGVQNNTFIATV